MNWHHLDVSGHSGAGTEYDNRTNGGSGSGRGSGDTSVASFGHPRTARPSGPIGLSLTLGDHALGLMTYFSDGHGERAVLDALDSPAIGMIYSDRLSVYPPAKWRAFLTHGDLIPRVIERPLCVRIRRRGGPGKLLERRLVTFSNRR